MSPVCKSLQLQNHEPETMTDLSMCDLVASSGVIVDCNKLDTVCLTNMVPKRMNIYEKKKTLMSASVWFVCSGQKHGSLPQGMPGTDHVIPNHMILMKLISCQILQFYWCRHNKKMDGFNIR